MRDYWFHPQWARPEHVGLLAIAMVALLLHGCASSSSADDIESDESGVFMPGVRVTFDFLPHETPDPELLEESVGGAVDATFAVDVGFGFAIADSTQNLVSGERIGVEDVIFTGPAAVDIDYEIYDFRAGARGGVRFFRQLSFEGILGLGFNQVEIELDDGLRDDHDGVFSVGPLIGGRISYQPLEWLKLYGEGTHTFAIGDDADVDLSALEAGVEIIPTRMVSLIVGWRRWRYEAERDDNFAFTSVEESDLDLEVNGPMVMLQITF